MIVRSSLVDTEDHLLYNNNNNSNNNNNNSNRRSGNLFQLFYRDCLELSNDGIDDTHRIYLRAISLLQLLCSIAYLFLLIGVRHYYNIISLIILLTTAIIISIIHSILGLYSSQRIDISTTILLNRLSRSIKFYIILVYHPLNLIIFFYSMFFIGIRLKLLLYSNNTNNTIDNDDSNSSNSVSTAAIVTIVFLLLISLVNLLLQGLGYYNAKQLIQSNIELQQLSNSYRQRLQSNSDIFNNSLSHSEQSEEMAILSNNERF